MLVIEKRGYRNKGFSVEESTGEHSYRTDKYLRKYGVVISDKINLKLRYDY